MHSFLISNFSINIRLVNKLQSYGLGTRLFRWISGRIIQVVDDGHVSGIYEMNVAMPQG